MNVIKKIIAFSILISVGNIAYSKSFDERINDIFQPAVEILDKVFFYEPFSSFGLNVPIILIWLVVGAVFFTIYMNFINLKGVKHAIDLIRGKYDKPKGSVGDISHFQALVTALSGTVGLGNIAGVASAMVVGGAGATFWMIVAGFLGMTSKFVECTLGVKYRKININGEVSGGPMYYLSEGLKKRGQEKLGKAMAIIFAILCVGGSFGGGNMYQANQSYAQLSNVFTETQGFGFIFGIIIAILVAFVIIGGIKKIASITDKLVPFMVLLYITFALIIIGVNIQHIGDAFLQIFKGAFSPEGIKGGIIGVIIQGFRRAAFSNEAGVGSAAIAHSAVKTDEPISEGIVSLLEPFIDTIVICTMTALVLVFTGFSADNQGLNGAALTSAAFSSVVPWFKYVLLVAIILFAFSTMISWSYYGLKAWAYLFGESKKTEIIYKSLFLIFIVVGSSSSLGAVMDFSDMMILGMAVPNMLGMYILSKEIKLDLSSYFSRLKSGEIKKYK